MPIDLTQFEDPRTQGLLGTFLRMLELSGPSPVKRTFGSILGNAGAEGMQQYRVANELQDRQKERGQLQQMREMQLAELMAKKRREDELRSVLQGAYQSPVQQALAGGEGPTPANALKIPQMPGGIDFPAARNQLLSKGNLEGVALVDSMRPRPEFKVVDKSLVKITPEGSVSEAYRGPQEEKLPSAVQEYMFAVNQGYQGTFDQWAKEQKSAGATRIDNTFHLGEKGFQNSVKLAEAFKNEPIYKAHQEVTSAYGQIRAALENPSGASDLAAATKFMKLLDPGSVVRESELVMAMSTSGMIDRMANYANMIITGQKLTPTQRAEFKKMTDKLFEESRSLYNQKRKQYIGVAEKYKLDPEVIPAESIPRVQVGTDWRKATDAEVLQALGVGSP